MMSILDQVARSSFEFNHFCPKSTQQFFALRLAAKLGDGSAAQHYANLAEHHSESQLLVAFHRAIALGNNAALVRRFHVELERLGERNGSNLEKSRIAAIRVERRAMAVAILSAEHLEYTQPLQLASAPEKATASAVSFVSRMIEKFSVTSVAVESIPNGQEIQRALLQRTVIQALTGQSISIWEVAKGDLFAAFSHPPLDFRKQLREIASQLYPVLDEESGRPWTQDAAALGLYVQTERLFNNIN